MLYFDYNFAGLAIKCKNHSNYVKYQFSHALTLIKKVPLSAISKRLITITPLTTPIYTLNIIKNLSNPKTIPISLF